MVDSGLDTEATDEEIKQYYKELFTREEIVKVCKDYGEELNQEIIVKNIRAIQNNDGLVLFSRYKKKIVGAVLGIVSPCLYSDTKYGMEISVSTLPCAPVRTVFNLHRALIRWANDCGCKYIEASDGLYTPRSYGRFLGRLGYKRIGCVYLRRLHG